MRNPITPNEAVKTALHKVEQEMALGLSAGAAITVVAGRTGIKPNQLEYFYEKYKPVTA